MSSQPGTRNLEPGTRRAERPGKYLVTGAAGFIGSHVVERLLEEGHAVKALDNFSTGKRDNLAACEGNGNFHLMIGDVRNLEECHRACEEVDCVLHQAALGGVPRSVSDPIATNQSNLDGVLNMLVAARDAEVGRFVFASSSSTYGDGSILPLAEGQPAAPISPYAVTKRSGEQYCSAFHRLYGLRTVSLRYFGVFGPRQDASSHFAAVIPAFIAALLRGEAPTVYGDGGQTRDFTYVSNVVDANLAACCVEQPEAFGRVYNVGCGQRISIGELYEKIAERIGSGLKPGRGPARMGDVRDSQADITAAREALGWEPRVTLEQGLERTIEFYRQSLR